MLQMISGTRKQLRAEVETSLAQYRHRIFIQELGWPLPTENGLERDSFDRQDTIYVVASDTSGEICGCGRLLPTTKPYLLSEDVWELSRFAISTPSDIRLSSAEAWQNTCFLMANIVSVAASHGATRLIAFSAIGNERLLRRMGVNIHRVSTPQFIDGKPVLAFWIEIDDLTRSALGINAAREIKNPS